MGATHCQAAAVPLGATGRIPNSAIWVLFAECRRSASWLWGASEPIFPPCASRTKKFTTLEVRFSPLSQRLSADGHCHYTTTTNAGHPFLAADATGYSPPLAEHPWMQASAFRVAGGILFAAGGVGSAVP